MRLRLATWLWLASSSLAYSQQSTFPDQDTKPQIVLDAQNKVCQLLVDCGKATFRYGKIVQYQGKAMACGQVELSDVPSSNEGYQVWMVLVGLSTPPMLESSFPQPTRDLIHAGPCSQPTTEQVYGPANKSTTKSLETSSLSTPNQGKSTGDKQLIRAFETCIAENQRTEFDKASDVIARISSSCRISSSKRIKGRGDPVYGNSIRYDADSKQVQWIVPVVLDGNYISGATISPYKDSELDQLSRHERSLLFDLRDTGYKLMEVTDAGDASITTYDAQNAFGAKTKVTTGNATVYSIGVPTKGDAFKTVPLFSTTVANDAARDLVPNLDVEFDWEAIPPCVVCFKAGMIQMGDLAAPTFGNPYSLKTLHKYVFARIANIRLIDRRNGEIIASGPSNDVEN